MHRLVPFVGLACVAAAVALLLTPRPAVASLPPPQENEPEPRDPVLTHSRVERLFAPHFHVRFSVN
jgi:hypothetical protein